MEKEAKNKEAKYSELRSEWVGNLRKKYNIVRLIGSTDFVYGFTVAKVDKNTQFVDGSHDKAFYSEAFVNAFAFGGVVVFDTDNEVIAKKLLAIIENKKLNLGGCEADMHPDFYCILRFDGLKADDDFLNGRLYQL